MPKHPLLRLVFAQAALCVAPLALGSFREFDGDAAVTLDKDTVLDMAPGSYRVMTATR